MCHKTYVNSQGLSYLDIDYSTTHAQYHCPEDLHEDLLP